MKNGEPLRSHTLPKFNERSCREAGVERNYGREKEKKSDILGRLVEGVRGRGREGGGGVRRRREEGSSGGGFQAGVWEKGSWGTKNEQNKQPKAPHTQTQPSVG